MCVYVWMCVCIHVYVGVCMYVCMYMYIQAGFGPPGLESRFQSLFHDFTFLPVTYVTIRSRVFKRLYLPNGDT